MYRGFNLKLKKQQLASPFAPDVTAEWKRTTTASISKHFKRGTIDATALEEDWFGGVSADIFLSHSHHDMELAIALANMVYEKFGLTTFIDSFVWGYSANLLKEIDNNFCLSQDKKTYSYSERNKSTSHVHLMLSTALTKMIDRCEATIFLNTPQSIVTADLMNGTKESTASPWIYAELIASKYMRQTLPERRKKTLNEAMESRENVVARRLPKFLFDAPLSHLTSMTSAHLIAWQQCGETGDAALDCLYDLLPST
jgi:hypothetical protein